MQLDHQGYLVQNILLKPGSGYKPVFLCSLWHCRIFMLHKSEHSMPHSCRTLLRVTSPFLLGVFSLCDLRMYLQVTGVGWCISHQTRASERKEFQALNICSIQSAAPSFLIGHLQNSKILLGGWPEILSAWAK